MITEELNALIAQAEGGDVSVMNQVAHVYSDNADFKDSEKAFIWYKKSAELGNVNSMSNLGGWCYLQGNGTEKNIPLADEWLKKCVENGGGWTWAFNEIANIFANDAQYKDFSKAFYWYKKSAETGDVLGMSNLGGWCYLWGNGVEKNIPLAIELLEKAAKQDNVWSMNKLTYIYGEVDGYIDFGQALKWFEILIQKDSDPQSGVYQNTQYDKNLYEKVKTAVAIEKDYSYSKRNALDFKGDVVIPNGVKRIGNYVFYKQSDLMSVSIPDSVTSIGEDAFSGCTGLTSVKIPNSVTSIGSGAFSNCANLSSINIPDNIQCIEEFAFSSCEHITSLVIPDNVVSIERNAFSCCSGLTSITIGKSVKSIGNDAFGNCDELISINWNAVGCDSNTDDCWPFDFDSPIKSFIFGYGVNIIPNALCRNMSELKETEIPNSVISIGNKAFSGCSSLSFVGIPDSVTSIGDGAFACCSGLTSVTIPESVKSIGDYAFEDCVGLTSVTIRNGVTEIGERTFRECKNLISIELPSSILRIGNGAFFHSGLTSVCIENVGLNVGQDAFSACLKLSQIIVPKGSKQRFEQIISHVSQFSSNYQILEQESTSQQEKIERKNEIDEYKSRLADMQRQLEEIQRRQKQLDASGVVRQSCMEIVDQDPVITVVMYYTKHLSDGDTIDAHEREEMQKSEYLALKGNYEALCAYVKRNYCFSHDYITDVSIEKYEY